MVKVLDGKEMSNENFNKKFFEIVGCPFDVWINKYKNNYSISDQSNEWYHYNDGTYYLNGCAYEPPVLFKN